MANNSPGFARVKLQGHGGLAVPAANADALAVGQAKARGVNRGDVEGVGFAQAGVGCVPGHRAGVELVERAASGEQERELA